jgi:hypothetical protein
MAIDGQSGMQVRAKNAVIFGTDTSEIDANTRHAAATIGEEGEVGGACFMLRERRDWGKESDWGLNILIFLRVTF